MTVKPIPTATKTWVTASSHVPQAPRRAGAISQFPFVMVGSVLGVLWLLQFLLNDHIGIETVMAAEHATTRLPVPSGPLVERAQKTVREVFGSDVVGASTTAEHLLLATKLFKSAQDSADDPAGRYVLLETAAHQANEAGDLDLLLRIEHDKTNVFDVPRYAELLTTLKQFHERSDNGRIIPPLVEASLRIAQAAEADDDFPSAIMFARFALDVVKDKDEHAKLKEQVIAAGKKFIASQRAFAEFQAALEKLKSDPKDSVAHTVVGKRLLFVKYDLAAWPHLAQGIDAELQSFAERELAEVEEGAPQVALADAWWNLSQQMEVTAEKTACLRRAKYWYQKASTTAGILSFPIWWTCV